MKTVLELKNGARRRLFKNHLIDSYPFISGDYFALRSDVIFTSKSSTTLKLLNQQHGSLFLHLKDQDRFQHELNSLPEVDLSNLSLRIHNGDIIPSEESLGFFATRFRKIEVVNYLGRHPKISPLPIGLENPRFFQNGIPSHFLRELRSLPDDFSTRKIDFLINFKVGNNFLERTQAFEICKNFPGSLVIEKFLSPNEYRKLLLETKFVISPPGNGPDCHRTWEAMYLGAVPIVLGKAWPFQKFELPVLIVNDWSEAFSLAKNFQVKKTVEPLEIIKILGLDI